MTEKRYWIVRTYQSDRDGYVTEQFLSLDDALSWAKFQHDSGYSQLELYEARPVALSFEPDPTTPLDKSRWTGADSETPVPCPECGGSILQSQSEEYWYCTEEHCDWIGQRTG